MIKTKFSKIILLSVSINLLIACVYSYAQSSIADVNITPCTANCLILQAPASLTINGSLFLNNSEKRIYTYGNYGLNQGIKIIDARNTGNFTLDVTIDSLTNQTNTNAKLDYSNIGILTFNNSSTNSVDGRNSTGNPMPISSLDPVVNGKIAEPFNQATLASSISSGTPFDDFFTYFSGTGSNSDTINIINAVSDPSYIGSYSFGIGFIFHFPSGSVDSGTLQDGLYGSTVTFTLIGS